MKNAIGKKAIGMIEFKTVASGLAAADLMAKTAEVDVIEAQTVCPGKYMALISGSISAVNAAVDAAKNARPEELIGSFILGNPHDDIFPALYGSASIEGVDAIGIFETYDVASCIVAADAAAKTAIVTLMELRVAKGMCGKSFFIITGDVAACQAAIDKARDSVKETGMYLDSTVIARPSDKIISYIV